MNKRFTGMLDRNAERIYEDDWIRVGTRRGEDLAPQSEQVVRRYSKLYGLFINEEWSAYHLVNARGERMDMQLDQELRELIK